MQVYLPDELYARVKELGLPASELLQEAVRREVKLRLLNDATDKYLEDLVAEVGEPTQAEIDEAARWWAGLPGTGAEPDGMPQAG